MAADLTVVDDWIEKKAFILSFKRNVILIGRKPYTFSYLDDLLNRQTYTQPDVVNHDKQINRTYLLGQMTPQEVKDILAEEAISLSILEKMIPTSLYSSPRAPYYMRLGRLQRCHIDPTKPGTASNIKLDLRYRNMITDARKGIWQKLEPFEKTVSCRNFLELLQAFVILPGGERWWNKGSTLAESTMMDVQF